MASALPVGIAIATVIGGIAVSPLLLLPGAAVWLLAVGIIAAGRTSTHRPPPDVSHLPPSIQAELAEAGAALDELKRAARSVPSDRRMMFAGIEQEAEEVREAVLRLGLTAGDLHRSIEANRPEEITERIESLRARLEEEGGDAPRPEVEHEMRALEHRIRRREELLERLERYRASIRALQDDCRDLADRATDLATRRPEVHSVDENAPERRMSEMKASIAALEELMQRDTDVAQ